MKVTRWSAVSTSTRLWRDGPEGQRGSYKRAQFFESRTREDGHMRYVVVIEVLEPHRIQKAILCEGSEQAADCWDKLLGDAPKNTEGNDSNPFRHRRHPSRRERGGGHGKAGDPIKEIKGPGAR